MPYRTADFVRRTFVSAIGVVTLVGSCVACSSAPEADNTGTALPPGTARISLGDTDLGVITRVKCSTVKTDTTIETGDGDSGTTSVISNSTGLNVHLVQFNNVAGFTGAYTSNVGGEGNAEATLTEATYDIRGVLRGFGDPAYQPTTKDFRIRVSC